MSIAAPNWRLGQKQPTARFVPDDVRGTGLRWRRSGLVCFAVTIQWDRLRRRIMAYAPFDPESQDIESGKSAALFGVWRCVRTSEDHMKLLEKRCAGIAVISRPEQDDPQIPAQTDPSALVCEVVFDLSVSRNQQGFDATDHFEVKTVIRSVGPFADRQSVETAAARQLPALFREMAAELEKDNIRKG
jgi:hypothetical protein